MDRKNERKTFIGGTKMETKSRYEVIAELEGQKRQLILQRDSFSDHIENKLKHIKLLKREVEDEEEELDKFKKTVEEKKDTIKELIASVDESLKRL